MALKRAAVLAASFALASLALQGCGGGSKDDSSTTTTTAPSPSPSPSPTPGVPTTTATTTTTITAAPASHCRTYDDNHECIACEDGFDLNDSGCYYHCRTDVEDIEVNQLEHKGLCLDDTTFQYCADEIPHIWPNTKNKVRSVRLFSSWQGFWPDDNRTQAWKGLIDVVKKNDMQVLVGTQITCNETDDDRDWKHVLDLMQQLGPEHIMGVAIGNELELLYQKRYASHECIENMWRGGYFWRKTVDRVKDMDALGVAYSSIPVTSVFGAAVLGGNPFFESANAMCTSYLRNATKVYGNRWVYTINVYPYLDPNNHPDDPSNIHKCDKAIAQGTCLDDQKCMTISILVSMRMKIKQVTQRDDSLLWIGETGWSTPQASTLNTPVAHCPDFSSEAAFEKNYRNFLGWDLNISSLPEVRGPDHVFYFTMRDSVNFGHGEHFGLVGECGDTQCKLQKKRPSEQVPSEEAVEV